MRLYCENNIICPVFLACNYGHYSVVAYMLEKDPDQMRLFGPPLIRSASLSLSCFRGFLDMAILLLENDPEAAFIHGNQADKVPLLVFPQFTQVAETLYGATNRQLRKCQLPQDALLNVCADTKRWKRAAGSQKWCVQTVQRKITCMCGFHGCPCHVV